MAKAPKKLLTTPKGIFKFPSLTRPDFGTKEYPCPEGRYKVTLILRESDPEVQKFLATLNPIYADAQAFAERKFSELKAETRRKLKSVSMNPLYTEALDKETEEPTGDIEFSFKMAASGTYKKGPRAGETWTRKPGLFDAKRQKIVKAPDIWGGTVGRVSFEVGADFETGEPGYFIPGTGMGGLKLALAAAQVIDLVSGGERSASDHGFGEEDGYEGSAEDDSGFREESEASDETGAGDDGDF